MAKTKETITLELALSRDTKGTHLFKGAEDAVIRSLYIQKEGYPNGAPKKIKITVESIA